MFWEAADLSRDVTVGVYSHAPGFPWGVPSLSRLPAGGTERFRLYLGWIERVIRWAYRLLYQCG